MACRSLAKSVLRPVAGQGRPSQPLLLAVARPIGSVRGACQPTPLRTYVFFRARSTVAPRAHIRSTSPSSTAPDEELLLSKHHDLDKSKYKVDQGNLSFTRTSLFKLTIPLESPVDPANPPFSDPASQQEDDESPSSLNSRGEKQRRQKEENQASGKGADQNWESVERKHSDKKRKEELIKLGQIASAREPEEMETLNELEAEAQESIEDEEAQPAHEDLQKDANAPVHSVVFLLHAAQPLSYIANLIRAESPNPWPGTRQKIEEAQERKEEGIDQDQERRRRDSERIWATLGTPPISFLTKAADGKRWSPATAIGDYLREAARVGSFVIRIGERNLQIAVPSFEDRTRFLRGSLYAKTEQIEKLTKIKEECNKLAHHGTKRVAYSGAIALSTWWFSVLYFTFMTGYGWDVMEPITYLTGLGTVIGGYLWFLYKNREASYRAVLHETASRRQEKLYMERGFNIDKYQELIEEVKGLRKTIKAVADEYDLEWSQSDTRAGQSTKRALKVIHRNEALDRRSRRRADGSGKNGKKSDEEEEDEDDEEEGGNKLLPEDKDGDGVPDDKQRAS